MQAKLTLIGSLIMTVFGCLLMTVHSVNAQAYVTSATNLQVSSGKEAVPIYRDATCSQPTGTTLATTINDWAVTAVSQSNRPTDGTTYVPFNSFDLGFNQWVKSSDVFLGGVVKNKKPNNLIEAYSNYQQVPIYDSPQLWHITGYLNPQIADWKVSQYASNSSSGDPITRVDLGAHQWVATSSNVLAVRSIYSFEQGAQLFNQFGTPTTKIQADDFYRVYGVKNINGQNYVKLGNNKQWANLNAAHIN